MAISLPQYYLLVKLLIGARVLQLSEYVGEKLRTNHLQLD